MRGCRTRRRGVGRRFAAWSKSVGSGAIGSGSIGSGLRQDYELSLACRFGVRELLRGIRGILNIRGQAFPSFLFVQTKTARIHGCSGESDTRPAKRKGIPGMIGNSIPRKPMPRHVHPISLRQNPPPCLCWISIVLTWLSISAYDAGTSIPPRSGIVFARFTLTNPRQRNAAPCYGSRNGGESRARFVAPSCRERR